jgi:two-component system CheB/CheR fusion protein
MTIVNGHLILSDQPKERSLNFPIDIFFRSLAEEAGLQAVGIILSGTGSDGSKGCKSIKEEGGLVMVQDPMSAKFDGMPQSVIAAGFADYILPPGEMLRELLLYANEAKPEAGSLERTILKNEQALERIIKIIRNFTGNDFSFYKRPTLSRRVAKRMVINKIATLNEYIDILYDSVEERELLSKDFLIGVTKFFRDAEAFKYLENEVIPAIFKQKENDENIKIWSIGCSTGEEVYSMAILFREYMEKNKTFKNVKFFATDIDKDALEKASKGIYSSDIADEMGVSRFEK